jgi:hypothetical protein
MKKETILEANKMVDYADIQSALCRAPFDPIRKHEDRVHVTIGKNVLKRDEVVIAVYSEDESESIVFESEADFRKAARA